MKLACDRIALRDGAMGGPVVEAPATEHTLLAGAPVGRAVFWNHIDVVRKRVLAPFPDVARHVVNPELVRCFLCDGLRVIAVSTIVPRDRVDVVAATVPVPVLPVWSAAGGVFPFGFRRQPEMEIMLHLFAHGFGDCALVQARQEAAGLSEAIPRYVFDREVGTTVHGRVLLPSDMSPERLRDGNDADIKRRYRDRNALRWIPEVVGRGACTFDVSQYEFSLVTIRPAIRDRFHCVSALGGCVYA